LHLSVKLYFPGQVPVGRLLYKQYVESVQRRVASTVGLEGRRNVYIKIRVLCLFTVDDRGSSQGTPLAESVVFQAPRHIDEVAQLHPLSHRVGTGFPDRYAHTHSWDVVEVVVAIYRQLIARRKSGIQIAGVALQSRAKVHR